MARVLTVDCLDAEVAAEVHDPAAGRRAVRVPYAGGHRLDPVVWLRAVEQAVAAVLGAPSPAGVDEVVLCACPKGAVVLDAAGAPVAPAMVGDDPDTAPDAGWLTTQVDGGAEGWTAAVGSVPTATWTASKLSWLHRSDTEAWSRLATVLQPQDWLVLQLTGRAVTDRRTARATGYWSDGAGYRLDLLRIVDAQRDWASALPPVAADGATVGEWDGVPVRLHVA